MTADWIDSHPTARTSIKDDHIVIRIPKLAIPFLAAAAIKPTSVFVGDIGGLRDEIVEEINALGVVQAAVGAAIVDLLKRGTKHAVVLRFPNESA
jgi:hypothetical protein